MIGRRSRHRSSGASIEPDSRIFHARERKACGHGSAPDFRQVANPLEQLLHELSLFEGLSVAHCGQVDLRGQNAIGIEAGSDLVEPPETLEEKAGARQEHQREGEFGDAQGVSQPRPS